MVGLLKWLMDDDTPADTKPTVRELIQRESSIGSHVLGEVPKGHSRQFFNLDRTTWVWHESWVDGHGKERSRTTRYEIHENGILKVQEDARYYYLEGTELANFIAAIRRYYEEVSRRVYGRDPATGKLLTV